MSIKTGITNKKYPLYFGSVISDSKINESQVFALLNIKEGEKYTVKETASLIKNWKKNLKKKFNAASVEINAIIWTDNRRYIDIALKIKKSGQKFKKIPPGSPRLPIIIIRNFKKYQARVNELLKIDVKKTTRYPADGRWQSKDKILREIDKILLEIVPRKTNPIFKTIYSHKNFKMRVLALQLLNWAPPTLKILDGIIKCLEDSEHSVHNEAASIALPKILFLKNKSSAKKISKMLKHFNLLCRGKAVYVLYILMKNKISPPQSALDEILKMSQIKSPILKFYALKIKKNAAGQKKV